MKIDKHSISVTQLCEVVACEGKVFGPEPVVKAVKADGGRGAALGNLEHERHHQNVTTYRDLPANAGRSWIYRLFAFLVRLFTGRRP